MDVSQLDGFIYISVKPMIQHVKAESGDKNTNKLKVNNEN